MIDFALLIDTRPWIKDPSVSLFWKTKAKSSLERLSEFCRIVGEELKLEMQEEFCKLLGLPDILSNQILDLVLDDSIRNDDATIVKFEEVSAKNEVAGKILADVFGYLVRSWT